MSLEPKDVTTFDLGRAVRLNAMFASSLGWGADGALRDLFPGRAWALRDLVGSPVGSDAVALGVLEAQHGLGLVADGVLGPVTLAHLGGTPEALPAGSDYIVVGGTRVAIAVPVVSFDEPGGLSFVDHPKNYAKRNPRTRVRRIVAHWDVCLSARSCYNVLHDRGLSTHFCVDVRRAAGGGLEPVIFQFLDPIPHMAYHAGEFNGNSVGVDLSNAVDPQYQSEYRRLLGVPRPLVEGKVHGASHKILGFYPEQIEAFVLLCRALAGAIPDVALVGPKNVLTTSPDCQANTWSGVCGHLNLTAEKWDPGPEWEKILGRVTAP